nr:hypothetical protein CFP56_10417 [Quercus suber]
MSHLFPEVLTRRSNEARLPQEEAPESELWYLYACVSLTCSGSASQPFPIPRNRLQRLRYEPLLTSRAAKSAYFTSKPWEKIIVPMNEVGIAFWPPATRIIYLATAHLNSCTAIAIVSIQAGILAHIAPLPPGSTQQTLDQNPNASADNARTLLRAVVDLYRAHQDKFSSGQTYVVAGVFNNGPAMPDVLRMIQQFFANLGLPVIWKSYPVITESSRPEGYSSVVVKAERAGAMPHVYINGRRVH